MTLETAAERVEMMPPVGSQPRHEAAGGGSRTLIQQAMVDTFSRLGARLGAIWISTLVIAAVFAPWIANSYPLLVKIDGRWSSPLIAHLQPSDVTLLTLFVAGAAVLLSSARTPRIFALSLLWFGSLTVPLTLWQSVIRDGWRPAPAFVGATAGNVSLVIVSLIDAAILVLAGRALLAASTVAKTAIIICSLAVIAVLLVFPVHPPVLNVYEQYRDLGREGKVESVVNTVVPFSPNDYQRDNVDARIQPPSRQHWMGTEQSGADVFSRMLHASRIALSIGFIATGISISIGITVGGLMGYYAGLFDIIGMRLVEIIEAVPTLILLLTVCAFFGRSLYLMMTVIGLLSWTGDARYVRAEFLRLRKQDFVQAAEAAGLPLRSILFKHMLPNGITPVLVNSSFGVASAILLESVLSFLGLGLVDEPSWGQLLEQARTGGTGFIWWIATFPGLAIFLTVFSYNLIGEAMRDALDPQLRKRD